MDSTKRKQKPQKYGMFKLQDVFSSVNFDSERLTD